MHVTRRVFLYISRKKGKTISLFLMIFIVAVFLVSCFSVLQASGRLGEDIRTSLGAAFYIRANTEVSMNENGEAEVRKNEACITQEAIDEMMRTGEIKCCNPMNYGFAKSDAIHFIPGEKHTDESDIGKVTALRFSALAPDFTDEAAVLTEGTHITEADRGKILISEPLAKANHLSVGDSLTLTHARLKESGGAYVDEIAVKTAFVQVEVCGIYKLDKKEDVARPTAGVAENEIYASLDVLDALRESEAGVYTGEADFYITDPDKLENVIRDVRQMQSIDWTSHFIFTNDFQYSRIADRLSSLGDLMKMLIVLVSVVSASVLTLLLMMRMRGRMREAGILLGIGISKGQIAAGFLLEVLSVAALAWALSYIVSLGATSFLGRCLFGGLRPNLLNEETLRAGMDGGVQMERYLKLGGIETFLIYTCQCAVAVVSTFVSYIATVRLKPRDILSKMS